MFSLFVSNAATALVERLAARVRAFRSTHGLLAPVDVVFPHRALGEWVLNELVRVSGGVIHLRKHSPRALVERYGGASPAVVPAWNLAGPIFEALRDEAFLAEPALAPARRFIEREPEPARRALRTYRLAREIASTFELYADESPEFLTHWSGKGGAKAPTAGWQRLVWDRVRPETAPEASGVRPALLFVFDVPTPSRAFVETVRALAAAGTEVVVLARSAVAETPAKVPPDEAPPDAIERWAWTTRLSLGRWIAAGAALERPEWRVPDADGLPSRMQRELLGAESPTETIPASARTGLRWVEAPSVRRECENIAAGIWRLVRESPAARPLRFHEVAVAVPAAQQEEYLPQLRSAFSEPPGIPRVDWDAPLAATHQVAIVTRALLDLPLSGFRRSDVLGVLRHPLVAGGLGQKLPDDWADWIDRVGVFHGIDARDHDATYLENTGAASWDQGLARLALGTFLAGERSGADAWFQGAGGERLLAEERTQSENAAIGSLLRLARSLLADARFAKGASLCAADWAEFLGTYVAAYVRPTSKGDQAALGAVLRAVRSIDEFSNAEVRLPFDVAVALAVDALDAVQGSALGYLTQGVVIASPQSLRGLPFRAIVIAGAESGAFPARDAPAELDAREGEPRPLESKRLCDSATFLDLVTSASESLVVSRVAVDPITGDAREPSPLLHDLDEWLTRRGLSRTDRDALTVVAPVDRATQSSDPAFAKAFPRSAIEAAVAAEGRRARALDGPFERTRDKLKGAPSEFARALELADVPGSTRPPRRVVQISLSQLRQFLECPIQGYAKFALRMSSPEDERGEVDDETFAPDPLTDSGILTKVLEAALVLHPRASLADEAACGALLEKLYDEHVSRLQQSGRMPVAFFAERQRRKDLERLGLYARKAVELVPGRDDRPPGRVLRFGRADRSRAHAEPLPPIVLEAGEAIVHVVGMTQVFVEEGNHALLFARSLPAKGNMKLRRLLQAWVEHVALSAAGRRSGLLKATVIASENGGVGAFGGTLEPIEQSRAREYLTRLARELLGPPIPYRCPASVYLKKFEEAKSADALLSALNGDASNLAGAIEGMYGGFHPDERVDFSPVRDLETFPLPGKEHVGEIVARLHPFVVAYREAAKTQEAEDKPPKAKATKAPKKTAADAEVAVPDPEKSGASGAKRRRA